tara:strand:+ start:346 stop:798 length:453 start_codon:yes stop_codon:yes gene_type:complete
MQKAIICDIDGTLSLKHDGRTWYDASTSDLDKPNKPVLALLRFIQEANCHGLNSEQDCQIIFVSGRQEKDREPTEKFLKKHMLHGYPLFMRETGDSKPDTIVKMNIYKENIKGKYDILFVLDDRNSEKYPVVGMWRILGLACFQVADGNF